MGFPSEKEIKKMRKLLLKVEPTHAINDYKSSVDRLKHNLCREFIIFARKNELTQTQLAQRLEIDPARVSEILKYKIELYTIDRLLKLLEVINPNIKVTVA